MASNHFNADGHVRMVDVSEKPVTVRSAIAEGSVTMLAETGELVRRGDGKKGDVLQVARIAAVGGVKRTPDLIPLCHPLAIDGVEVECLWPEPTRLVIRVTVRTTGRTGVEMEALCGATVAALTVYDMCKSVDRAMELGPFYLLHKEGGASGSYERT